MANLTNIEKRRLERLFEMDGGYVLNLSNRIFEEFVFDSVDRNIYDARYENGGGSKANRLRVCWNAEGNGLVGKLLSDMLDYAVEAAGVQKDDPALEACRRTVSRLMQDSPVPELDALTAISSEKDFEAVTKAIKETIDRDEPGAGLDRLHTFVVKYIRFLCVQSGVDAARDKPLQSLFGAYVKRLRESGHIESEMAERILKSSISIFEAFNDVRNNRSLAHDNQILNYEEVLLIFNYVTSSVRFLRNLDSRIQRTEGPAVEAEQTTDEGVSRGRS
jgi:hypothetical protein